ncbi:MAG: NAD(P)-dependent oxidoreductase, partial [Gammaproteobacteria bacterium]
DALCSRANIVTSHVPFNDSTRGLLSRERLALLPKGAVVLNFAREGIVDREALIAAIDAGAISTYVTDFPSQLLIGHDNVICLPHLGASTREAEENSAVMVVDNLREFLENGNIRRSVNFPEAVLRRTRRHRLAITNANVPNMVGQVSTALAEGGINIADLLNVSKGDVAQTLVDLDGPASEETMQRIRSIDGILSLRILPIID